MREQLFLPNQSKAQATPMTAKKKKKKGGGGGGGGGKQQIYLDTRDMQPQAQ